MGITANTVSIYQYTVRGQLETGDMDDWVAEQLEKNAFNGVDDLPEEEVVGWVRLDDPMNNDFSDSSAFKHDHYYAFSMRRDQRRVPSTLLKNLVGQQCEEWLAGRPQLKRVPASRRTEIRENIKASLLGKALPVPATYDLVWNTETNIVSVSCINARILDLVEDEFRKTFDGFSLVPVHPIARAERLVSGNEELGRALVRENQAPNNDVLLQINKNRWLGWEFMLWVMYRTSTGASNFNVTQDGPLEVDEPFIAYLYDRFVLVNEQENSVFKSSIIGPQDDFAEARKAVQAEKNVAEGVLYFEKDENNWRLNLKTDIFAFGSYRCPRVQLEKDDITDPFMEREAVFFERMHLMETGLQLFDSLLDAFLAQRLGPDWSAMRTRIDTWLYQ